MEPSTEHEREIARRVDELAAIGILPMPSITEIAGTLPFPPSPAETQFLVQYTIWRRDQPTK